MITKLSKLRETDYDAFMEALYTALTGEFKGAINDNRPKEEKLKALNTMINYFINNGEQYMKCSQLVKIKEQLEKSEDASIN